MVDDDAVTRTLDTVLPRWLEELRRVTGLPVVFGGPTRSVDGATHLTINETLGTHGNSLRLIRVAPGRGLGGLAMARNTACRVNDYASTAAITHDYDHAVVEKEQLTAIVALPIVVRSRVAGVLYGALRDDRPIGDVAVRNANTVTAHLSRDVSAVLDRPATPWGPADDAAGRPDPGASARAAALADLAQLLRENHDPELHRRLTTIHRGLTAVAPRPLPHAPSLAPREVEALQLVETGATNAEIAHALGLTVDTVKSYLRSAMRKLGARNRTKAVLAARASGLL